MYKKYFNFHEFGPLSSVYLKLADRDIGINVVKIRLKELEDQKNKLRVKKARIEPYKTNKKDVLKNAEALYNGVKIIMDAFENETFGMRYRPSVDVSSDLESDPDTYDLRETEL